MTSPPPYKSDRWITPAVVVVLILAVLLALLAVIVAAAWLTSLGKDPGPMFDFVTTSLGALTGAASLVLQLANRKTTTKTERNTGVLAGALYEVADAMPKPVPRHAAADYPPTVGMNAAPAPRGS